MKSWDDPQCETTLRPLPTRATVAHELRDALIHLYMAEDLVLDKTLDLRDAQRELQDSEDAVLIYAAPPLDGRNAETRGAQLRDRTVLARRRVDSAEDARMRAVSALEGAKATFSAWKVLARLVAGEDR